MKAVGYIRVSTDEQAIEGISIENQMAKIKAYCELNDLKLLQVIEDDKSGKNLKRPGMQALISKIGEGDVEALVVYKLDRLSRRVMDTLGLIETFEKRDIAFHSINERLDTKTAMGRFTLTLFAALAQMEREQIAERTKDVLQHKIQNHQRAGEIPYGWDLASDGNNLLKNEEEQKAKRLMKRLKKKGYSLRKIGIELTAKGFKPKKSEKWHANSISKILKSKNC